MRGSWKTLITHMLSNLLQNNDWVLDSNYLILVKFVSHLVQREGMQLFQLFWETSCLNADNHLFGFVGRLSQL